MLNKPSLKHKVPKTMPELPEIENVKLSLAPLIGGKRIKKVLVACDKLRVKIPKNFAKTLEGKKVQALDRRGKYLLIEVSGGQVAIIHLGMSGQLVFSNPPNPPQKHDHVIFQFSSTKGKMVFNDTRRFGFMDIIAKDKLWRHKSLADLGSEPLSDGWQLEENFKRSKTSLKAALLNQKLVAGIGNIYACEALYHAKFNPTVRANSLSKAQYKALQVGVIVILERAVAAGGSSLKDFLDGTGASGNFQKQFKVYGRNGLPCGRRNCCGEIRQIRQNGRSTFYCPDCQK